MEPDHVDEVVRQWNRERPDLDVSGMAIIGRLARVSKVIENCLSAVFAKHDLEFWEFDVLATLMRNGPDQQLTPGQLLKSMMLTSGAMTNRIDRLEKRGYVDRVKDPTDGRQVLVTLTANGLAKVEAALVDHVANELSLIQCLDKSQQAHLIELLTILQNAIVSETDQRPATL